MRDLVVKKSTLREADDRDDLKHKTPSERIEMMWQLALDSWAFKEKLNVEPRLQRHVVVVKRGRS